MSKLLTMALLLVATTVTAFTPLPLANRQMTRRAGMIVALQGDTRQQVKECLSEAENSGEVMECYLDDQPPAPVKTVERKKSKLTTQAKRSALMGGAESLDQCLSEAESGLEAEECQLDYDQLVSGAPAGGVDQKMMGIALAGAALVAGAAYYYQ
jgi:hypothetical protein